ncbi:DUF6527 family protein [Rhodoblastus sp.]|uniref:DUF6527 family protein n=1 Tax=Rhodoblastus sp. TaxID=1962975 RepID=UPI002614D8E0|nr:DUF6527 family protein [Rhodoblastus sp.]
MGAKGVLRTVEGNRVAFDCPGCKNRHVLTVRPAPPPSWEFNGDYDRPTFRPSILVSLPADDEFPAEVCHSFVTDGQIHFLGDCTHELAGKTVPLVARDKD